MNLEAWLKQDHPFHDQLAVMDGLCSVLNESHERGVMHGDLRPSSVELAGAGQCKLLFDPPGASLGLDAADSPYVAPEVAKDGNPSPKSDIYSAGVIFYQMLSGKKPAAGGSPPPPLRDVRPDLPRDLSDAVTACIETDPDWRPKDLSYLLEVVRGLRGPAAAPGRPAAARAGEVARPRAEAAAKKAPVQGRRAERGFPLVPVVAVVVLMGAGGVWFWLRSTGPAKGAQGGAGQKQAETVAKPPESAPAQPAVPAAPPTLLPGPGPKAEASKPPSPTPAPPTTLASVPATPRPGAARPSPASVATPPPVIAAQFAPPPVTTPPPPTPPPEATPPPPPAEPAVLRSVSPPSLKTPATTILDIHGKGLRSDHQARILRGNDPVAGLSVIRQKFVNPGLMQVAVRVDEGVLVGAYNLFVTDPQGNASNVLPFQVTR